MSTPTHPEPTATGLTAARPTGPIATEPTETITREPAEPAEKETASSRVSQDNSNDNNSNDGSNSESNNETMPVSQTSWTGHPKIKGPTEPIRMFLLTCSMIGLQFCWGTEMTYCTPYLLSLGLSKSMLSLVWIAGPLSGLVMQPVVGMISDKWTGKYGRRRPFMVAGTVGVVICLVLLAWMEDIVGIFISNDERRRTITIVAAVFDIYVLDFVINVVQATCRSLVVDMLPVHKQHLGSAWVSRVAGLGHLLVYAIGSIDLMATLGQSFLGNTQFKKVCVIAAIALILSQGITCYAVQERALVLNDKHDKEWKSAYSVLRDIWDTTMKLPPPIRAICWVTFWSWIGWFPFLFYSSTWVGEIYLRYSATRQTSNDALSDVGRVGSTSLVVFSLVSFIISIILPYLARSVDDTENTNYTVRPSQRMAKVVRSLQSWHIQRPTIAQAWTVANIMFAVSMVWAPTVRSVGFATVLVALCGVPWAIGGWASFALIGAEINKLSSDIPQAHRRNGTYQQVPDDAVELDSPTLHLRHDSDASAHGASQTGELAGIYLGILNLYTTMPQFIGTGISTIVFSILEPGKSPELTDAGEGLQAPKDGMSGIGVCLFIGALCAGMAAWKCRDLGKG
ncbi:hypothetical protein AMS68_004103 [Peltaster fructicola]|uniref:Major facilitator superfamily (MFS) profile domain-containing protein n=1 Tax=Peltaster fructicola TaxID=286661 RepID=A0A6H0XV71_9PEZI|nr:hypothetical protein AMS68_004103 [Peltaster fructicola]